METSRSSHFNTALCGDHVARVHNIALDELDVPPSNHRIGFDTSLYINNPTPQYGDKLYIEPYHFSNLRMDLGRGSSWHVEKCQECGSRFLADSSGNRNKWLGWQQNADTRAGFKEF